MLFGNVSGYLVIVVLGTTIIYPSETSKESYKIISHIRIYGIVHMKTGNLVCSTHI